MKLKEMLPVEFWKELDPNLKLLAREIRKDLREENDHVIALTGYPGVGKSNDAAVIAALIDDKYDFEKNICFIPSSEDITRRYKGLPMFSVLHIDEATRGLHKHKWFDKIQQTLTQLYDTEREGHYLCTLLLMPRFQSFTEYFRNFRIKYWIHIPKRGLAIVYRRDEDKDVKDPWHLDENYKKKIKRWRGKRIFERGLGDTIRIEQMTENYWFYFKVPKIPEEVWASYQKLKADSRIEMEEKKEEEVGVSKTDSRTQLRLQRMEQIREWYDQGYSKAQMAAKLNASITTVANYYKVVKAERESSSTNQPESTKNNIFNISSNDNSREVKEDLTK